MFFLSMVVPRYRAFVGWIKWRNYESRIIECNHRQLVFCNYFHKRSSVGLPFLILILSSNSKAIDSVQQWHTLRKTTLKRGRLRAIRYLTIPSKTNTFGKIFSKNKLLFQLPYPLLASLNGVAMFGKTNDVTLLSTITNECQFLWRDYHNRY